MAQKQNRSHLFKWFVTPYVANCIIDTTKE